jgi:DNA-binding NarL/FixJ family response regulator
MVDLEARLEAARRDWNVTARELDVLRQVVAGDGNKEIAVRLAIHESSVERHVGALLRKACCDTRTRLVAHFWTRPTIEAPPSMHASPESGSPSGMQ